MSIINRFPSGGGGTGTYQSKTATPSVTEQNISPDAGYDALSSVTVNGDADLVAANIKKDVQIFGVTGTLDSGTPALVARKEVNFIDYDGTILYAYTLAQAQALVALPEQPTHTGLTNQGWNYTLAQVNALTHNCDIGAIYVTNDGKTRLYIHVPNLARAIIPLYFSQTVAYGVTIDWGDGSSTATLSSTGNKNTSHTYTATGDFTITLTVAEGCTLGLGNGDVNTPTIGGSLAGYKDMLHRVEIGTGITTIGPYAFANNYALKSATIPSNITSMGNYAFFGCMHALFFVVPNSITTLGNYAFSSDYSLINVSLPTSLTSIGTNLFQNDYSLSEISLPSNITSVVQSIFDTCTGLAYLFIPSSVTTVAGSAFYNSVFMKEYHFKSTTPPTLGATNSFYGIASDCVIYVPTASVAAYKAATNWSTYASKIVGE